MSAPRDSDILTAALRYAAQGWPVFPCSPETKAPLVPTKGEKEAGWCLVAGERRDLTQKGMGGFKLATIDEATIRDWWKRWPNALIGMPTGREGAKVMVVDLDPKIVPANKMLEALQLLCNGARDKKFDAPLVRTQSGGLHVWFQYPDMEPRLKANGEAESDNRAGLFKPKDYDHVVGLTETIREHVDIRGDDGYVILPPSRMNNGNRYEWESANFGVDEPLPRLPARILDAILKRGEFALKSKAGTSNSARAVAAREARTPSGDKVTEAQRKYALNAMMLACDDLAATPSGQRHDALNKTAFNLGTLVGAGALSENVARSAIEEAAHWPGSVFTDKEANTINDGMSAGIASPRDMSTIGQRAGRSNSRQAPASAGEAEARHGATAQSSQPSGASPRVGSASLSSAPPAPVSGESRQDPRDDEDEDDFDGESEGLACRSDGPEGVRGGFSDASGGGGGNFRNEHLGDGDDDPEKKGARISKCLWLPLNDTGNAERLLIHFGANFINVREVGLHWWTGTHWQLEGGDEYVARCAQDVADLVDAETVLMTWSRRERELIEAGKIADATPEDERTDETRATIYAGREAFALLAKRQASRRKFAVGCGNVARTKGMITQALPHRTVEPDVMDCDPMKFNVMNGTLHFSRPDAEAAKKDKSERGRQLIVMRDHNRDDMITKLAPATFDGRASAPRWRAFLALFQPSEASQLFLQVYSGYGLTGLTDEQVLVYLYGRGANGKSTFAETLLRIMGGYARTLNPESVSGDGQRRGDQATPEIAQLPGARMVIVSELAKGASIREALLKALTGGERLQARHLHKGFFDFYATFKAWMSGNDMPKISGTDDGIWRRMLIVLWPVRLEKEKRRKLADVLAEFEEERSGILNWMLDGLAIYLEQGLKVPDEVRAMTESHRSETDILGGFLAACVDQTDNVGDIVQAKNFYEAFVAWCEEAAKKPLTNTMFGLEMKSHGFQKDQMAGRIFYQGVKLKNVPVRGGDGPPPADDYPDGPQ